jgi:hypothetical protein
MHMKSTTNNRILRALSPTVRSARVFVAVAIAGALISACDVHGVSSPGTLSAIEVSPNATLAATSSLQMVAVGRDADGRVISISPTWSVAQGGTITSSGIFSAGLVTGVFPNTVTATVGAVSGSATITVIAGAIATITVVPTPVTLAVTAVQQFTAVAKDAGGNVVAFTPTWSVVAGGGSIDAVGNFTAGGTPGTYTNTVQASNNAIKAFATVIVTTGPASSMLITPNPDTLLVGAKQQFVASGKDVSGNPVVIAAVWSVVAGGGTVDVNGMFTAGATPGTFANTVKATSGSLSGTATVVVTAGPLASIKVTPNPDTLAINGTQQFIATGNDAAGNPIVITPVWAVVAAGGTINATGLFTAGVVSGTFTNTVRANSGGFSGFATVVVKSGSLANIAVTPNPAQMQTNSTQQFAAVGTDAHGNVVPLLPSPVWQVVNGGGVIDALGMFTSGAVASTFNNTIQATSGSMSGFATVITTAPPPPPPPPALVNFGAAAINGIMAGASVTCSGAGVIQATSGTANIAISPGSTMNGFPPCVFSGTTDLGDAQALADQNILTAAYNTLAGQPCPAANNYGTVDYAGKTLPAGVYCSASTMNVTGTLTLDGGGDPNANFVFQAGSALIGAANIVLINSAQAKNVYWQVGSSATLNASAWQGNIVAFTSISLNVNSTLFGRALARNGSVTMDASANVITLP